MTVESTIGSSGDILYSSTTTTSTAATSTTTGTSTITSSTTSSFYTTTMTSTTSTSGTTTINSLTTRPLHVEGNKIKTDLGQVIYLRGWNLGSGTETVTFKLPSWEYYDQSVVDNIFNAMHNYGGNCVRYQLVVTSWTNNVACNTAQGSKTYQQCLDDLLTRAANHGIYVILSFARINQWASGKMQDNMGFDPYTESDDTGVVTSQSQFTDIVAQLATVLGSHNNLIIEPWNEAFYSYQGSSICSVWQSIYNEAINKIRVTETSNGYIHHLILCQLGASLQTWSLSDPRSNFNWLTAYPLTDSVNDLIYGSHCYRSWGSVGGSSYLYDDAPTDYSTIKNIYDSSEGVKNAANSVPIIIGEMGALSNTNEYNWLSNTLTIFNEWQMCYLGFSWRDDGGAYAEITSGSQSTTGGTVNEYGQILVDSIKTP